MASFTVLRSFRTRFNQKEIIPLADGIVNLTQGNPTYREMEAVITALKSAADTARVAIGKAGTGFLPDRTAKSNAIDGLYEALTTFAMELERHAKDDPDFVVNAGMQVSKERENHTSEPPPPINVLAVSNGVRGQAIVTFDDQNPGGLITHAFEWRDADLTQWNNGQYAKGSRTVLTGLPSLKKVDIRLRSLCSRSRHSEWSEQVTVAVL